MSEKTTRVAGFGNDGNVYGVTSRVCKARSSHVHRKAPCPTCPWRRDQPTGRFPAEAFRMSADTAYDGAMNTFACHESGTKAPATCAGFLLANSVHNLGVRLSIAFGRLDLDGLHSDADLYTSYREMAIANGVPESDPRLERCRADLT